MLWVSIRSTNMLITSVSRHTSTSKLYTSHTEATTRWCCKVSSLRHAWLLGGLITVTQYCSVYGTSSANIDKLQRLQNMLARVVTNTRRQDHITPVLSDLHWLPLRYRIKYKIALITFKALTTRNSHTCDSSQSYCEWLNVFLNHIIIIIIMG